MTSLAKTKYSLNQIEHTVRKAARGTGLAWGVAEDAGRAARWLHMIDLPGATLFATALLEIGLIDAETKRVRQHTRQDTEEATITLSPVGARLSPLVVGPCIGDWINSREAKPESIEPEIEIENVTHPLILAGYCGVAAEQTRLSVTIQWQGFQMHCTINSALLVGEQEHSAFQHQVRVATVDSDLKNPCKDASVRTARIGSVDVDKQAWNTLQALALKTYVEASESSRLAGAGAGLNDND